MQHAVRHGHVARHFAPALALAALLTGAPEALAQPPAQPGQAVDPYAEVMGAPAAPQPAPPPPPPAPAAAPPAAPAAPQATPDANGADQPAARGLTLQVRRTWANMMGFGNPVSGYPFESSGWTGTLGFWAGDIFIGFDLGLTLGDAVPDAFAAGVTLQRVQYRRGDVEVRTLGHLILASKDTSAFWLSATVGGAFLYAVGEGFGFGAEVGAGFVYGLGKAANGAEAMNVVGALLLEWAPPGGDD